MSKKQQKIIGQDAFEQYYSSLFQNQSTTADFFSSLRQETYPILRVSPQQFNRVEHLWQAAHLPWNPLEWYPYAIQWPEGIERGTQLPGYEEGYIYPMNASSLIPPLALQATNEHTILDACAAPGGKTLFIADLIHTTDQQSISTPLLANDTSPNRRRRLQETISRYGHSEHIDVIGKKAEILFKQYPNYFDRILADVPCSSEKHVYNSHKHLHKWTTARIRQLKQRQIAIVSGLFEALAPGGRLVYSTCAITPEENEEVIETLLKKKKERMRLINLDAELSSIPHLSGITSNKEITFPLDHVMRIIPHHMQEINLDPMFVAAIEKTV